MTSLFVLTFVDNFSRLRKWINYLVLLIFLHFISYQVLRAIILPHLKSHLIARFESPHQEFAFLLVFKFHSHSQVKQCHTLLLSNMNITWCYEYNWCTRTGFHLSHNHIRTFGKMHVYVAVEMAEWSINK